MMSPIRQPIKKPKIKSLILNFSMSSTCILLCILLNPGRLALVNGHYIFYVFAFVALVLMAGLAGSANAGCFAYSAASVSGPLHLVFYLLLSSLFWLLIHCLISIISLSCKQLRPINVFKTARPPQTD